MGNRKILLLIGTFFLVTLTKLEKKIGDNAKVSLSKSESVNPSPETFLLTYIKKNDGVIEGYF